MKHWYKLHDSDLEKKKFEGVSLIRDRKNIRKVNRGGYGIFWAINDFKKGIRTYSNLEKINAWFVDMDSGMKNEMLDRIHLGPMPSALIETKNGFHVYFYCQDNLFENRDRKEVIEEYKRMLKFRLQPFYESDKRACDGCRILRVPNFFHMKDPDNPFLVKCHYENDIKFTLKQMKSFFPEILPKQKFIKITDFKIKGENFWDKAVKIPCVQGLLRLSGHPAVGGEVFEIKDTGNGKKVIYVDGKSTSCWIDRRGLIGSTDNGGPCIANWVYWYLNDWGKVAKVLREVYPELRD